MSLLFEELLKESKDILVYKIENNSLIYLNDLGIGFMAHSGKEEQIYNHEYFEKYIDLARTHMGIQLNNARVAFTRKNYKGGSVCDVGVGGLAFCTSYVSDGYDINPFAERALKTLGLFGDPYINNYECLTMWDVIEHIDDPRALVANSNTIVLSTPIYDGFDHIVRSKHFKPDEHLWYFTNAGLEYFMNTLGFKIVDKSDIETVLGRDKIGSYCFKRNI